MTALSRSKRRSLAATGDGAVIPVCRRQTGIQSSAPSRAHCSRTALGSRLRGNDIADEPPHRRQPAHRVRHRDGVLRAVQGVSFTLARGEVLGLVGESGSGKSVTGFSIMGLVDPPGRVVGGSVRFDGEELVGKSKISCGDCAASASR